MPQDMLLRVLSFILLQPLKALDKKVLKMNLKFIETIKDLFDQVCGESNEDKEESPGNFPELNELLTIAKPVVEPRSNTPVYNRRDVTVNERANKGTQASQDLTVKISNSLPLMREEAKQKLNVQADLTKARIQARGTIIVPRKSAAKSLKDEAPLARRASSRQVTNLFEDKHHRITM